MSYDYFLLGISDERRLCLGTVLTRLLFLFFLTFGLCYLFACNCFLKRFTLFGSYWLKVLFWMLDKALGRIMSCGSQRGV